MIKFQILRLTFSKSYDRILVLKGIFNKFKKERNKIMAIGEPIMSLEQKENPNLLSPEEYLVSENVFGRWYKMRKERKENPLSEDLDFTITDEEKKVIMKKLSINKKRIKEIANLIKETPNKTELDIYYENPEKYAIEHLLSDAEK